MDTCSCRESKVLPPGSYLGEPRQLASPPNTCPGERRDLTQGKDRHCSNTLHNVEAGGVVRVVDPRRRAQIASNRMGGSDAAGYFKLPAETT